jgi:hypothetical protein
MWTPHAHDVLSFMSAFLALWGVSLLVRGVLHRSRHGSPTCPACRAAVTVPGLQCQACRYEAHARKEFWPRKVHKTALVAGILALLIATGCLLGSMSLAQMVSQQSWAASVGTLSAGLALGVLSLIAWAIYGEPSRGRKRCPKCWYEMATLAVAGRFQCPECGHDAESNRGLMKRRRRTKLAIALIPLLLAALWMPLILRSIQRGPTALIPTPVLILGMWFLPERLITGVGQNVGPPANRDSLADRLVDRRESYAWQRAWVASSVQSKLDKSTDPATLLRAMHMGVIDDSDRSRRKRMFEVILETSTQTLPMHVRMRQEMIPRLSYEALWNRTEGDVRPILERHLAEIQRRLVPADPEAWSYVLLCLALGEGSKPLLPQVKAAATDPASPALLRRNSVGVLIHLSDKMPEAYAIVIDLLKSGNPELLELIEASFGAAVRTPGEWAVLRELGLNTTGGTQAAAIGMYAKRTPRDADFARAVLEAASTPGPRQVGAAHGLCSLIASHWVDFDRGFPIVRAAVRSMNGPERLALVGRLYTLNYFVSSDQVMGLVSELASDPDPAVAAEATRLAPKPAR